MNIRLLVAAAAVAAAPVAALAQPVAISRGAISCAVDGEALNSLVINGVTVSDVAMFTDGLGFTSLFGQNSGFGFSYTNIASGNGYAMQGTFRSASGDAQIVVTTSILGPYDDGNGPDVDTAVIEQTFAYTNLGFAIDDVNAFFGGLSSQDLFSGEDIRGFNATTGTPFIAANGRFWAVTADDTSPEIDFGWEITDLSTQVVGPGQGIFDGLTNSVEAVGSQLQAVLRADDIAFGETVTLRFRHLFGVNGALTSAPDDFDYEAPSGPCPGDLDGDNDTDVFDFAEFAADFGCGTGP